MIWKVVLEVHNYTTQLLPVHLNDDSVPEPQSTTLRWVRCLPPTKTLKELLSATKEFIGCFFYVERGWDFFYVCVGS